MSDIIPHWLSKQADLAPHHPAIELEDGKVITYKELQNKSKAFARKLNRLGINKGDCVGIYSTNDPLMITSIYALSYLGAVVVLLNIRLTKAELTYQIQHAKVKKIIYSNDLTEEIDAKNFSVAVHSYQEIDAQRETTISLKTELNLNDVFTIIYTSGTTGSPKGVMHTYGNHWWSAIGSSLNLGLMKNDKWLAVLPMFHVGGLSIYLRSVIYGTTVYLQKKYTIKSFQEAIFHKNITIASVVTTMLQQIVNDLGNVNYPSTVRCMLLGGGPAPESLLETAKIKNIPVFQSYGMTETSSQIVTLSPADALDKIGSSGKPLFPAQLKINLPDENGVGEIFVKGPMVTSGYFQNEKANGKSFIEGWLATGDLGYIDDNGFLYVVDRRTDLIISGGENVYPTEIENTLMQMHAIKEVGVIGKADATWGRVPVAFIVKASEISKEEIIKFAKENLAGYKVPKEIYFLERLPRNASNKLVRKKLYDVLY